MIPVELVAVRVDLASNTPVVLLQEIDDPRRVLPIFIGAPEATAIAFALQGVVTPRPMTHDLIREVIENLGATLEDVLVTELKEATYFAELHLAIGTQRSTISARPSDAIAVAARTGSQIYVSDELMEAEGVELQSEDGDPDSNPEEVVSQFKEFLDSVRPEDFQS
ncbi:MAG TPA: bifunctional nuclease family protein [Acidimicrobiales bacterium]|nr:bifunctional nuclease family protein [Acidimicrobiales bacterium]